MSTPELQNNPNIIADGKGSLPDWYTHFGDKDFALSALSIFYHSLQRAYPKKSIGRIVALGSGNAFYERTIASSLHSDNRWVIKNLIATDLQQASLDEIPTNGQIPILAVKADSTNLPPLPDADSSLILSRAVEHYLPNDGIEKLLVQAGNLLNPGELYIAQISSGSTVARKALSAGLHAIAGKEVSYLSLDEYRAKANTLCDVNHHSLFREICHGLAFDQPRSSIDQARRYLTPAFLGLHGLNSEQYLQEVAQITALRESLGKKVQQGQISREDAIQQLNNAIAPTKTFAEFRSIFTRAALRSLTKEELQESQGVRVIDSGNDVEIDIEYPVVVWQKQSGQITNYRRK